MSASTTTPPTSSTTKGIGNAPEQQAQVTPRDHAVFMAKLAERAERYQEMVEFIKQAATSNKILTVEERNLLSVGYKNVVGLRRASWRIISTIEHKEEARQASDQASPFLADIQQYRGRVEGELMRICRMPCTCLTLPSFPLLIRMRRVCFISK